MDATNLCFLSADELVRRYRARELSPVDVVETVLDRLDRLNPLLNAFCTPTPDLARKAARQAETHLARAEPIGPLHGVPVSIKDHAAVAGVRTTVGSVVRCDWVPDFDSPCVERLRAAGAIILGKTNMSEFGWKGVTDNRLFGITRNPWNLQRTAGGSSGGAGAAVAAGLGPLAHGADGAGSIRIPAAFCGIFGLKPSFGRVPQYPRGGTESLSHDGPMTRTVRDAALMLDVMAGADERDRNSLPRESVSYISRLQAPVDSVRGLRVAWSADLGFAAVEPDVLRVVEAAVTKFEVLGCRVEAVNPGLRDPYPILKPLYFAAMGGALRDHYPRLRDEMDQDLVALLEEGEFLTAYDYGAAILERVAFCEEVRAFMQGYDLLLTPAVSVAAFDVGRPTPEHVAGRRVNFLGWTPFTYPFNLTGQPAASVPAGFTREGLPVGLQIVGRQHADAVVLQAAAAFEAVAPWANQRPPVDTYVASS